MFYKFLLFEKWIPESSFMLFHGAWQSEVGLSPGFLPVLAHRWKELGNFTNDRLSLQLQPLDIRVIPRQ